MARTIQSPGVEIREVDFTVRPVTVGGTSVFLAGFASQGPIDEVLEPGNILEFEQIYGSPTNSAEQYFYQTAKAILGSSPARLVTTRLPYGAERGEGFSTWRYSALVYPVRGVRTTNTPSGSTTAFSLTSLDVGTQGSGYTVNPPTIITTTSILSNIAVPADLRANLTASGSVSSITVVNPGRYFTTDIQVSFVSNGNPGTVTAPTISLSGIAQTIQPAYNYTSVSSNLTDSTTYLLGTPTHLEISADDYQNLISNNIDWTNTPNPNAGAVNSPFTMEGLGNAGLIVVNKAQTSVNNSFEGYYVGAIDNNNYNPATPFNGILSVKGVQNSGPSINSYVEVPEPRLNFALSATKMGDGSSVSEIMENLTQYDLDSNSFDDTISLGVFKLRKSVFTPDTLSLDSILAESYVGSLDYHRQIADQTGGPAKSFYLGELANNSSNINIMVNPYISNRFTNTWITSAGIPGKKVRLLTAQLAEKLASNGFTDTDDTYTKRVGATQTAVRNAITDLGRADALFTVGVYTNTVTSDKTIGSLPGKLERAFELVENADIYQINLAVEAGLGTVYVNSLAQGDGSYADSKPLDSLSAFYVTNSELTDQAGLDLRSNYTSVANVFVNAAEKQRKDFMVILDPLRNIFVQGSNTKVINSKKLYSPNSEDSQPGFVTTNFSQHIYWPLRHQFGSINSSYVATYSTWAQVVDSTSNRQIWVPFSGFAASLMANVDQNFQPWFAPAGFTRGVVTGVNDLGVYPKQKQRDQLYKISINPVAFFPAEGFVVFGQKTMLKKPSAFDRINVRRLFLNLEVSTRDTAKYFVFEPNTLFTRTRVVNTLSPIFDNAKNTEGLYDYLIVCDERNNTPEVIDNYELKIDIYIKPVRTAEFVLVSFYATRTSQDFQELIGG
jgi:hypothetical protein